MKTQIEKKCDTYGWTEKDIRINKATAGHACHHIRNPLAIIAGQARNLDPDQAKKLLDAVERIVDYTNFLQQIAEDK